MNNLALEVTDLTVRSNVGRVLAAVPSLAVLRGETIGIKGPSGAGKSTLLYALAGLVPATHGHVHWNGHDITAMSTGAKQSFRAAHIGFIFQDHHLFDELGGLDNASVTALFRPRAARKTIRSQARDWLQRLNVPYDNRTIASFSGGERQRVAVARALTPDPQFLLADEPTASLDRISADALADDLMRITRAKGTTVLVVSHDPNLLARMDRVLTLTDGHLSC